MDFMCDGRGWQGSHQDSPVHLSGVCMNIVWRWREDMTGICDEQISVSKLPSNSVHKTSAC